MSEFDPTGDPMIIVPETPEWDAFAQMLLKEHRNSIFFLQIEVEGETAVLRGDIASREFTKVLSAMVAARPGILDVRDETRVTGVFVPAAQGPDIGDWAVELANRGSDLGAVEEDTDLEISRYASVRPIGRPQAQALFEIEVDLVQQPNEWASAEPMYISDLQPGWTELTIDVQLSCHELDLLDSSEPHSVIIHRNAPSTPCRFTGRVNATATKSGSLSVKVVFLHAGRFSGSAQTSFELLDTDQSARSIANPAPTAPIAISPSAAAPTMNIMIDSKENNGVSRWTITCDGAGGTHQALGDANLASPPREYFHALFENVPFFDDTVHQRRLKTIGERIWSVSPQEFRELYTRMRSRLGADFPIQIVTNDAFVPWEMMHPTDIDGADHLFMSHPVARWPFRETVRRFGPGRFVSFVPNYSEGVLPATADERSFVETELGAERGVPKYGDFLAFLSTKGQQPVQVVHFAGHGSVGKDTNNRGLKLEDRWVTLEDLDSDILLGRNDRSLFVLNACSVGEQAFGLAIESWPKRLIELNFGGVVAPLWAIQDTHASQVVRATLQGFCKSGETLGEALRSARIQHRASSATPYAYLCFGDVMAKGA